MSLTWTAPHALWLLLAVPLVWLGARVGRVSFHPRQRRLQAAARSMLLAMLALVAARPVLSSGSSRVSIVYVVDASSSVASAAIAGAARTIDDLNRAAKPDDVHIVAFGATAVVLRTTDELRRLAAEPGADAPGRVDPEGTDLDTALETARAELAPGHVPRIVLFSDGRPNAGDVRAAVARLAAQGIPVHVEPLAGRDLGDTWVARLDVPDRVSAGATFAATVELGSQRPAAGLVELRAGGRVIASQAVSVGVGATTLTLDAAVDQPGAQVLEAEVAVPGDPLRANNQLAREVRVGATPRILYVEGTPASARYLSSALTASGYGVTTGPASVLPTRREAYRRYSVVVLSDVGRAAMPDAAVVALSDWVEQDGGGLLVAGGEAVYGEGGYRRSPLERLTPVTFERRDEPAIALIIVLDKSWSMAGQQMELCKAAAQAAVDALGDEQSVGVVTFNDQLDWDVTLRNVGRNRDNIRKAIAAIEPSGHTLIYPAIEQAYLALRDAKARAKHVVLLSDGRSVPDDYEGLVRKMVAEHMTVSSIAVGPAADVELLTNIANWGGGRSYVVGDAAQVPQIFVKEARNIPTPAFDEKPIRPVVKHPGFLDGVDLARAPALRGRTATAMKDSALELLSTSDGDPLLAFWPVGLGRVAVFASDVKDRWAANWVQWPGYGPFFTAVARALERQAPPDAAVDLDAPLPHGGARAVTVGIEARDATGAFRNLLRPTLRVQGGAGREIAVPARQVAPGRYEARLTADAGAPLVLGIDAASAAESSRIVVPDPAAEYRFGPPDEALLRSIATATGGRWEPTAEALRSGAGDRRLARRPLWPALLGAALVLWLADLTLRRVRLWEGEGEVSGPRRRRRP